MEASEATQAAESPAEAPAAATPAFDPSAIHTALDKADAAFHQLLSGHVPDEVHRFEQHLATVKMVVDQAADQAAKDLAAKGEG